MDKHARRRNARKEIMRVCALLFFCVFNKREICCEQKKKKPRGEREESSLQRKRQCLLRLVNFDLSAPEAMEHLRRALLSADIYGGCAPISIPLALLLPPF